MSRNDGFLSHFISRPYEIVCGHCSRVAGENESFKICSGCKQESYCSTECQKKHWNEAGNPHKPLCDYYNKRITFEQAKGRNKSIVGYTNIEKAELEDHVKYCKEPERIVVTLCSHSGPWDLHYHFSQIFAFCQRLGCFKLAVQCNPGSKFKQCSDNKNWIHRTDSFLFCSQHCKKSHSNKNPAGSFWPSAISNQLDPNDTHRNGIKLFREAYSRQRQMENGFLVMPLTNFHTKKYPLIFFGETFSKIKGKLDCKQLLLDLKLNLTDIELNEKVFDTPYFIAIRIIQVLERLDYAKWPLINNIHDVYDNYSDLFK